MRNHTKSKKLQPHCSTQILPPAAACIIIYPEEPNFQRPRPLYQACTREPKRRSPRRPTKLFWSFSRKPAIGLHWSSFSVTPTRRCIATSLVSPAPPSRMTYCKKLRCRFFANSPYLREPAVFRAWTFRIASRIAFSHLKHARRWQPLDDAPPEQLAILNPTLGEPPDEAFFTLLDHVSPASRAVLLLRYQHDLTLEECAAILEIPNGTAKSRLNYGVTTLRKHLTSERKPA